MMTLSFDLDLKANQATNDLIYNIYLHVPLAIVFLVFESTSDHASVQRYTFKALVMLF